MAEIWIINSSNNYHQMPSELLSVKHGIMLYYEHWHCQGCFFFCDV